MSSLKDMMQSKETGNGRTKTNPRASRALRRQKALRHVSPFAGEPETVFLRDDQGNIGALVNALVLTPKQAKKADALGGWSCLALSASGMVVGSADAVTFLIGTIGPWLFAERLKRSWRRRLHTKTTLVFTAAEFIVRHSDGRTDLYSRQEPHRFRLESRHPEALKEAEEHEVAQERARMRGQVIRRKKYQQDTFHLVFDYRGFPHLLMEIMGVEDARRVLARIRQVDEEMDRITAMGLAPEAGPQSEWDDMPGKIPERL